MKSVELFGVKIINGSYKDAIIGLKKGGLMVVPSGPGLATIGKDSRYKEAVQNSDFAIPDSGYIVLLLRVLKHVKIKKLSGYVFLKRVASDHMV